MCTRDKWTKETNKTSLELDSRRGPAFLIVLGLRSWAWSERAIVFAAYQISMSGNFRP